MLRYGLPLSASAILSGLSSQFYNFLAAVYCTNAEIGNYSIATNFTVLITFFSTPISTVLFPAFSKLNLEEDCKALRDAFRLSVKYASLLVIPVAAAVMSLAQSAVATLFGEKYTYASTYLSLLSLSHIYTAFGSLSVGNLISSQGKTEVNMKLTLIAVATGLPLSLMLIPRLGVVGLILATLVAGAPSLIAALLYVKRHYGANVDLASSAKTLAVSATSALATSLLLVQLLLPSWAELVIGAVTFLTAYILMAPIIGAVETQDIQNIREIIKELGPISTLINQPLKIMGKIASATQGRGELPSSTDAETG
jgi:O-antigen/teichoic acid export membrane protein